MGSLIDLSHEVEAGMITYRGLPAPVICDYLSRGESRRQYADGTEFQIGKIEMVANTGTYLDSPFHRFADGKDLSELDLATLAELDAVVVRMTGMDGRAIDRAAFGATHRDQIQDGRRVPGVRSGLEPGRGRRGVASGG